MVRQAYVVRSRKPRFTSWILNAQCLLLSVLSTDKPMEPLQPLRSWEPRAAAEKIDRYILRDGGTARTAERTHGAREGSDHALGAGDRQGAAHMLPVCLLSFKYMVQSVPFRNVSLSMEMRDCTNYISFAEFFKETAVQSALCCSVFEENTP